MPLLAVYGTLKRGNYNHVVKLDRPPLHAAYAKVRAEMYSNGRYPMLIRKKEEHEIYIEIYEVTDAELSSIDDLEEPFGYHREKLKFFHYDDVWLYFYSKDIVPNDFELIVSGNFEASIDW